MYVYVCVLTCVQVCVEAREQYGILEVDTKAPCTMIFLKT